jgi:hypothetical protein
MLRAQGYLIRLRMTWLEEDQQADDRLAATARAEMPVKGCPYPRLLADAVRG